MDHPALLDGNGKAASTVGGLMKSQYRFRRKIHVVQAATIKNGYQVTVKTASVDCPGSLG